MPDQYILGEAPFNTKSFLVFHRIQAPNTIRVPLSFFSEQITSRHAEGVVLTTKISTVVQTGLTNVHKPVRPVWVT